MITISNRVEQWVERNPFLREQLGKGLINHSALARYVRPIIEKQVGEAVSIDAITIALNRLSKSLAGKENREDALDFVGDISVQTGLSLVVVVKGEGSDRVNTQPARSKGAFFVVSQGLSFTNFIGKTSSIDLIDFSDAELIKRTDSLTGLTVRLLDGNINVPGVCSLILQVLANKAVNLQEVVSTHNELTVLFEQNEAQKALQTILELKASQE